MLITAVPAGAANIECLTIDENISYASPKLSQDGYEMNCILTANQTIEVADDKQSFTLTSGNYSFYKVQIQTLTPASFAASGQQLCTVFETKFTASLRDDTVEEYIPSFSYGMYVTAGGSSTFAGEGESQKRRMPVDGTEYTVKYIINPVTKQILEYRNDELITTTEFDAVGTGDITQIRFYPRPIPGTNADGEYQKENNKTELDYGADDGVVPLITPIIWDFDYMKVYQIPPYEVESSDPEDGSEGASVNGPYTLTLDHNMDIDTVNDSSVRMTNEVSGETLATVPMMFEPNVCTVYPAGLVEYYTKYRLSFLPSATDEYGFSSETAWISFTTEKRPIKETVAYADAAAPVTLSCGETLAAGEITGTMRLVSDTADKKVRIIAALYDKNDTGYVFREQAEKELTLASGETSAELPAVTVTDAEGQLIKYMVWDETGYPLTDAVVCDSAHIGI